MKIKITEIDADAQELRQSNTLSDNFIIMLKRVFQSLEPFERDETEESDEEE